MTRVLVADDHAVVRDGLAVILGAAGDLDVVGQAENGRTAVELAARLAPDVVVMDIAMPELNGIEATERIRRASTAVQVVILSMHATSEHVYRALRAGALGYLVKESAGSEVVEAVRTVARGRRYFSQSIGETVVGEYLRAGSEQHRQSPLERLSAREREVLQLVVEGRSSAEVGRLLGLSAKTVDTYRSRLMSKLGVEDLVGLIRFAVQHGLIAPQ